MPMATERRVRSREDWWVDIPAQDIALESDRTIQLRPGTVLGKMTLKASGSNEIEVDLADLQYGIQQVQAKLEEEL